MLGKKGAPWTKTSKLPGGEFEPLAFDAEVRRLAMDYSGLPAEMMRRFTRLYGTKAREILGDAKEIAALGQHFGADLYAPGGGLSGGVEWARTAQDVLWRRTKLGLRVTAEDVSRLEGYLAAGLDAIETEDRGSHHPSLALPVEGRVKPVGVAKIAPGTRCHPPPCGEGQGGGRSGRMAGEGTT